MESEEDIEKKFERFYAEALTSPLPKLTFHRPVKKIISHQKTKSPKVTSSSKTSKPKEEKVIHENRSSEESVTEVQQSTPVQQTPKNISHSDTTDEDKERSDFIEEPQVQQPSSTPQQEDPEDDAANDDDDLYPSSSGQVTRPCEDDEHEVSSIVDEEEEFFLHKPRLNRTKVHAKDRRLNLDKLWSRIIIHKMPTTRKDDSNGSDQCCLLRRNLKQGKSFFMEYLAQMKLLQENEDVKTKTRRGQKRKSANEVELSKASKVKKPMRQSKENTKNSNKEAPTNRTSKPKQGAQSRKSKNWTVTPKDSELKKPIRTTRQNAISQKALAQKTVKKSSSESSRRSLNQDQDGVIFIDSDETESEASSKESKPTSKSKQKGLTTERKSNNVEKISKGVPKTTPTRQAQKARPGKSQVAAGQSKTNNAAVVSEVEPLSRRTDAAGVTQRSPLSNGVAVDMPSVAMDDPLVAASMTEDWGVGIRPLFSSRGRRAHCGGVWKAIIDEI